VRYPVPELPTIPRGAYVSGIPMAEELADVEAIIEEGYKLFKVASAKFGWYEQPALPQGAVVEKRQPITEAQEACTIIMPDTASIDDCVNAVVHVAVDAYYKGIGLIEILLVSPYTNKSQTIYVRIGGDEEAPEYEYAI